MNGLVVALSTANVASAGCTHAIPRPPPRTHRNSHMNSRVYLSSRCRFSLPIPGIADILLVDYLTVSAI